MTLISSLSSCNARYQRSVYELFQGAMVPQNEISIGVLDADAWLPIVLVMSLEFKKGCTHIWMQWMCPLCSYHGYLNRHKIVHAVVSLANPNTRVQGGCAPDKILIAKHNLKTSSRAALQQLLHQLGQ